MKFPQKMSALLFLGNFHVRCQLIYCYLASDMKFPQLFTDTSEELPDMVSLVGNSVTRQVWGNFMSDAKNLTGNSLLSKENIYCNQKGGNSMSNCITLAGNFPTSQRKYI